MRFCLYFPFAANASFSKFPSWKVSTLPLFPDCYHNSLPLYHQNISSYLSSKNSCFLSTFCILHWGGRMGGVGGQGEISCFHRVQYECGIILRKPVADTIPCVDCYLLTKVSHQQSSLFFYEKKRLLIPLLHSIK